MKFWLIVILMLVLVLPSFGQISLDTTRAKTNVWNPTLANMELSYHKEWSRVIPKDTILLRINQYFSTKYDTVTIQARFDSVTGTGNKRWTHWTVTRTSPKNTASIKAIFPYNESFESYNYLPQYPNCYRRHWSKDSLAIRYQFQATDTAWTVRTTLDTLLTDTVCVIANTQPYKVYSFRVRSVYASSYGSYNPVLPQFTSNGCGLIRYDNGAKFMLLMRPVKLVNDGARTQVQMEVSTFQNPQFQYSTMCP